MAVVELRLRSAVGLGLTPTRIALAESVAAAGAGQAIILVSGILVARVLGVEDRGHLALIALIPMGLVQLGTWGMPIAVTYFVSSSPNETRAIARASVWPAALQAAAIAGVHGVVVALVLWPWAPHVQLAAAASMLITPALVAQQYAFALLQGQHRFRALQATRLLSPALYSALVVLLTLTRLADLPSVTAAWVVSYLVGACSALVLTYRGLPAVVGDALVPVRAMVKFGLLGLAGSASPIERFRVDQAVVGLVLSPAALGLYAVAAGFTNLIAFLGQSVATVGFPRIAAARNRRLRLLRRYFILACLLCAIATAALEGAIHWLVPTFYGEEFADAVPIARVLLVAAFLLGVRKVLGALARGAGDATSETLAEIVTWVALAVTIPILLPLWGVMGAALAMVITAAASLAAAALSVRRGWFNASRAASGSATLTTTSD